jgi:hypothetical protein
MWATEKQETSIRYSPEVRARGAGEVTLGTIGADRGVADDAAARRRGAATGITTPPEGIDGVMPGLHLIFQALGFVVSLLIVSVLFGAVYQVLPDKKLTWCDVAVGAISTAILFTIGKFLISLYIGSSAVASSYGAAGGLIVILIWIYYSAQIFLLGAEFTKAYATAHGSQRTDADAGALHPEIGRLKQELDAA